MQSYQRAWVALSLPDWHRVLTTQGFWRPNTFVAMRAPFLKYMLLQVKDSSFDKVQLIRGYKFCVAMENSITKDYITEKLWQVRTGSYAGDADRQERRVLVHAYGRLLASLNASSCSLCAGLGRRPFMQSTKCISWYCVLQYLPLYSTERLTSLDI